MRQQDEVGVVLPCIFILLLKPNNGFQQPQTPSLAALTPAPLGEAAPAWACSGFARLLAHLLTAVYSLFATVVLDYFFLMYLPTYFTSYVVSISWILPFIFPILSLFPDIIWVNWRHMNGHLVLVDVLHLFPRHIYFPQTPPRAIARCLEAGELFLGVREMSGRPASRPTSKSSVTSRRLLHENQPEPPRGPAREETSSDSSSEEDEDSNSTVENNVQGSTLRGEDGPIRIKSLHQRWINSGELPSPGAGASWKGKKNARSPTAASRKRSRHMTMSPRHNQLQPLPGQQRRRKDERWSELTPFEKQAIIVGEENPRALRSLLVNFLKDDNGNFRKHLDLSKHAQESGLAVTDATLQEIADIHPLVEGITAADCNEITDVGLWALARSCENLLDINLARCHKITHVGLRSLALRCSMLKRLVLNQCHNVNDLSIRVVAAGCTSLRHVSLEGCKLVTDGSLSELARCCKSLRTLNLKNCAKLCEFGDKALIELGQSASKLREIDLSGCEHVRDAGLRALAEGCPELKVVRASGCGQLTGASLRALARGCPAIGSLGLGECGLLCNRDTWIIAESFPNLKSLSFRGVVRLKSEGIRGLCEMGERLEVLNLAGCHQLDDECLTLMGNTMVKLSRLDLSGLPNITRRGVRDLCHGCLRLVNLELAHCPRLTRKMLKELCLDLPFVKVAPDRMALIPRPNAMQMILETEQMRVEHAAAVVIQKLVRGVRARGGAKRIKYWAMRRFVVSKMQAIIRGYLTRKHLRIERERREQARAALYVQRYYRGHRGRERARIQRRLVALRADQSVAALRIQAVFRGWQGRKIVARIRRDLALQALRAIEERNKQEKMALRIQRTFRGRQGYLAYLVLVEMKRLEAERQFAEKMAAMKLQAVWRRRVAYQELMALRAAKLRRELEQRSAVVMQRVYRGMLGRRLAKAARKTQEWKLQQTSAVIIQRMWRGCRGRHIAALMQSLATLIEREQDAACTIQTFWRSHQAVALFEFLKLVKADKERREHAALQIQRVFRGHKGREEREVLEVLVEYENELAPLRNLEAHYAKERDVGQTKLDEVVSRQAKMKSQVEDLELELDEVSKHRSKWYDSANVTGTLQRYRTSYLAQALRGQIEVFRAKLQAMQVQEIDPLRIDVRNLEKQHRDIVRQLAPREAGLTFEIRRTRPARIRARLKLREESATKIQESFRGYRVRLAHTIGGGHWQEAHDETSGATYYYNVYTQERSFQAPWAFRVLRDDAKRQEQNALEKLFRVVDNAKASVTWQQFFDETTGYPFWFNAKTNEYRWEAPAEFAAAERQLSYNPEDLAKVDISSSARLRETGSDVAWVEYADEEGRLYYYNALTQQAQWEKPIGFDSKWLAHEDAKALTARSTRVRTARASDWTEFQDEQGNLYYWNQRTGTTQWEKPAEFDSIWLQESQDTLTARSIRSNKDLGSDWQELLDPETGYTYYYNINTQETSWSLPPKNLEASYFVQSSTTYDQSNRVDSAYTSGDGDWVAYYDENGALNYYDPSTTEVATEAMLGQEVKDITESIALSQATESSPWQELLDVNTGAAYLWNAETGETAQSWEEVVQGYKDAGVLLDVQPEDLQREAEIAKQNADPMTFTTAQRVWDIYHANVEQDPQLYAIVYRLCELEPTQTHDGEHVELMQWLAQYVMEGQLMAATSMAQQALDRWEPRYEEADESTWYQ